MGIVNRNVAPTAGRFSAMILPPCASTIERDERSENSSARLAPAAAGYRTPGATDRKRRASQRTHPAVRRPASKQQFAGQDFPCHGGAGGQCFLVAEPEVQTAEHPRFPRLERSCRETRVGASRTAAVGGQRERNIVVAVEAGKRNSTRG